VLYELHFSEESIEDLKGLRAADRATVLDQIEQVLTVNPKLESKARVKLLRQPAPTTYRLRVDEVRVFYNVGESHVDIVRILSKDASLKYLGSE